jgi:uncharacterized protein YdiU (UPF0061 family)
LADELPELLYACTLDLTLFFRALAELPLAAEVGFERRVATVIDASYTPAEALTDRDREALGSWLGRYAACARELGVSERERRERMNRVNPKYVLRNYLAQLAIDKAEAGDPSMISELLSVLRRPYDEQPEHAQWAQKRPEWARQRAGCSMLSCSS